MAADQCSKTFFFLFFCCFFSSALKESTLSRRRFVSLLQSTNKLNRFVFCSSLCISVLFLLLLCRPFRCICLCPRSFAPALRFWPPPRTNAHLHPRCVRLPMRRRCCNGASRCKMCSRELILFFFFFFFFFSDRYGNVLLHGACDLADLFTVTSRLVLVTFVMIRHLVASALPRRKRPSNSKQQTPRSVRKYVISHVNHFTMCLYCTRYREMA
jgi:hypothetical protein